MSVEIVVPPLGESVSEATVAKWYKKEGDNVKVDELILELETEKVTLEINAPASGVIGKIFKKDGDTVVIGNTLGEVQEGGAALVQNVSPAPSAYAPTPLPASAPVEIHNAVLEGSTEVVSKLPPSARKLIEEYSLNAAKIAGTGKDGRITKGDVLNEIQTPSAPTVESVINVPKPATDFSDKKVERVRMSRLRQTIAKRLKDSQNTAAILTTFNEIDMKNIMEMRLKYRDEFEKVHGIKLGFMSFFTKAVVEALKFVPSVNAEIDGEDVVYKQYYDIGIAVGTEQGLVVPVVRGCDGLNFAGVEKAISALGLKARDGKLSMADLSGATFTISNGGVYGSLLSTPIINPPQSGILGLHKIQERPIAIAGKVEIRPMMYVALSYDHRIIDGKEAVTFLVKVKELIENPEKLLLGI